MIEILSGYLSHDRRQAIASGNPLPDRAWGTALFADISGFTPLTERLAETLGPRRGVEALSHHLDTIYDALITQVEQFGGNVVGFAGDAIICWFDGERKTALHAAACAFSMHRAMQNFTAISLPDGSTLTIAVKIALASGMARRFAVGDPAHQLQDVLAGEMVDRMAAAEFLATRGEVLADTTTIEWLNDQIGVGAWRTDPRHPDALPYAVLTLSNDHDERPISISPGVVAKPALPGVELLRPWMLPAVFNRIVSRQGEFLTELRPGVAVFTQFLGIDFEKEEAHPQLDALVRRVQAILARYEGTLIDLTVGDKGSYFHACFGALAAHEDDARRAIHAALEFQKIHQELTYLHPLQIGMSCGTLRTGTLGGRTRRAYGVLGDDVNLAARLMEAARPGEILVSGRVQAIVDRDFNNEPRGTFSLKGKTEIVPVFSITSVRHRNIRLLEPDYALPMVGRRAELEAFTQKLERTESGKGQVIGIVAEAGMGKSRLVTEMIQLAAQRGFTGFGGACQSSGGNTPYLVWQPIWQAFFDLNLTIPEETQAQLKSCLQKYAPHRIEALPLLSPVLGISLPENDFTQALDPEFRKLALEALLVDCLKGFFSPSQAQTGEGKLLIVLEDLHWLDPLSRDLLEEIARACAALPVILIMAYRPFEAHYQQPLDLENHPAFTRFALSEMSSAEIQALIRARLAYLFPTQGPRSGSALDALLTQICERAQGNPFFAEELLNYLHDQGLDPYDPAIAEKIELPNSLHQLILSRIDQLTDREKTTLKIASVIGRLFPVAWLHGYYPALGTLEQIKADLEELRHLDLTPLDTPEPELTYLFKHIVTQEVTYESLPFDTRARLHEQLAFFLEQANTQNRASLFDLLAYHYGRSENKAKQAKYFRKAGEMAQAAYANQAALDYYTRLLPLLNAHEQIEILLKRGAVYELMGNWDTAQTDYERALLHAEQSEQTAQTIAIPRCQQAIGVMGRWRGEYDRAMTWLEKARAGWATCGHQEDLIQTLVQIGIIHWRKGDFAAARHQFEEAMTLARNINDLRGMAFAINNLGNVAWRQGDHATAQQCHEESLVLRRQLGGKRGIAVALNNLGAVAHEQGNYEKAKPLYEESLALAREMGDKQGISLSLDNLGMVAQEQGDPTTARTLFQESLVLAWELGDKPGILSCLSNLGAIAQERGDYLEAKHLHEQGLAIAREMGDKFNTRMIVHHLGYIAFQEEDFSTAQAMFLESLELSQEIGDKRGLAHSLLGIGIIEARAGDPAHAIQILATAETVRTEIQQAWEASMRLLYDQTLDTLRASLGGTWQTHWETGTQTSLKAIRLLLTPLSPSQE